MEKKRGREKNKKKLALPKDKYGLFLSSYVLTCKLLEYLSDRSALFILGWAPVTSTNSLH